MRKFQANLIAMLICCVVFVSCKRAEQMMAPPAVDESDEKSTMNADGADVVTPEAVDESDEKSTMNADGAEVVDPEAVDESDEKSPMNGGGEEVVDPASVPVPMGMVLIPAGEFQMGSDDRDADADEQPVHTVYVDAFFMDVQEVTNAEYQAFLLDEQNKEWRKDSIDRRFADDGDYLAHWSGNNYPAGQANHPVRYVSWYAAMAYAQWAGKRLPTEAEWERAARGRRSGAKYPWGDTISSVNAKYDADAADTQDVRSYPPNDFGLYDVTGNVWEWCLDAYDANFYASSDLRNPISGGQTVSSLMSNFENVPADTDRVLRGGSHRSPAQFSRVANRNRHSPAASVFDQGFRCARAVSP